MGSKIIINRIKFNEQVAIVTITDDSNKKRQVVAKAMRKIAIQERKHNKPVMHVEMNESDARTLFSNIKLLETV